MKTEANEKNIIKLLFLPMISIVVRTTNIPETKSERNRNEGEASKGKFVTHAMETKMTLTYFSFILFFLFPLRKQAYTIHAIQE